LPDEELARQVVEWGKDHLREFPWRRSKSAFEILLAELLLQRTPYWKVERTWVAMLDRWPTPSALAQADLHQLTELVRPLGLISRAKTLKELAEILVDRHNGEVPTTTKELTALPGVGTYVAAAVRCLAFRQAEPMVDSVSARVIKRFYGLAGSADVPDAATRRLVYAAVPADPDEAWLYNLAILDLASLLCRPVRPQCAACPLTVRCASAGVTHQRGNWRSACRPSARSSESSVSS
jgi:A/G-specific adenine glycosylase